MNNQEQNELNQLESIVLQLYQSPNQNMLQFANEIKQKYIQNLNLLNIPINTFNITNNEYFQFWLLDLMIEVINKNYDNIPQNIKEDFRKLIINNVEHNLSTLYRIDKEY